MGRCGFLAAVTLFFLASSSVWAGMEVPERVSNIRCGTDLISLGAISDKVLTKCGRPNSRERISGTAEFQLEKWEYGPIEGYYYELTFRDGILQEIVEIQQ